MENKLKTLNDLQEDPIAMQHCNWVVSSYDLKQEAIKHLKNKTEHDNGDVFIRISDGDALDVEEWITYFFNIEESELK